MLKNQTRKVRFRRVQKQALKRDLLGILLEAIFKGRLTAGERLVEIELAQQFGVSRTPVREALSALANIGLIEIKPNCGAMVKPFGSKELRDIYQVRKVLEGAATQLACARIEKKNLESIGENTEALLKNPGSGTGWSRRAMKIDEALHDLISQNCGNPRLSEEIDRYRSLVDSVRQTIGNRYQLQERAIREHLNIIKALQRRKREQAAHLMHVHIQKAGESAIQVVFAQS